MCSPYEQCDLSCAGTSAILDLKNQIFKDSLTDRLTALEALRIALHGLKAMDPAGKTKDSVIEAANHLLELSPVSKEDQGHVLLPTLQY